MVMDIEGSHVTASIGHVRDVQPENNKSINYPISLETWKPNIM